MTAAGPAAARGRNMFTKRKRFSLLQVGAAGAHLSYDAVATVCLAGYLVQPRLVQQVACHGCGVLQQPACMHLTPFWPHLLAGHVARQQSANTRTPCCPCWLGCTSPPQQHSHA